MDKKTLVIGVIGADVHAVGCAEMISLVVDAVVRVAGYAVYVARESVGTESERIVKKCHFVFSFHIQAE